MKVINNLNDIAEVLNNDNPICFKTDTIWGLSINPTKKENIEKLYKIKKRSLDKPLIFFVKSKEELNKLVEEVTPLHQKLIDNFWPGPLTIIFKAKKNLDVLTAFTNKQTIALRIPKDNLTQKILNLIPYPLPTTSVNLENTPSLNDFNSIINKFNDENIYILNKNLIQDNNTNNSSTIVTIENDKIIVLREGSIKKEKILSLIT